MVGDFTERFALHIDPAEARARFVYRALEVFDAFIYRSVRDDDYPRVRRSIASKLGMEDRRTSIELFIEGDFYKCLRAIEVVYAILPELNHETAHRFQAELGAVIRGLLEESEVDLGVFGCIYRNGASKNAPKPQLTTREVESFFVPNRHLSQAGGVRGC